ncbi:sensor histidine kinase [Winogradskyella aurantia]|uniref:histidine kinase n=1 Tax=Winogradskyella aurantia TaxID=1915063 RepID=A0A265UPB9_9FLAO|nr:HAMP domain-containing sensor histidine kinase [Winogradskyella aurantia]OZV67185.1 two-component sensor histidine kinase [Winogradskyella aurantia]
MNDKRYNWILYAIAVVIVTTIAIQIYWNYKNYETNKQQLINDVQLSLDKAVDDYYANLAKKTTMGFSFKGINTDSLFSEGGAFSNVLKDIDKKNGQFKNLDSVDVSMLDGVTVVRGLEVDSMMTKYRKEHSPISVDSLKSQVKALRNVKDSLNLSNIQMLTSKIVISIKNDSLDLTAIDSLLKAELKRKNIELESKLSYFQSNDTEEYKGSGRRIDTLVKDHNHPSKNLTLSTNSKSTFLPKDSSLKLDFSDETLLILKRGVGGILISSLLVLAIISSLFYLLKIIKHQKELAEVKNDLISNITHEFKTPIATIGVALESINNFNGINDKEKTKKYINMSSEQLEKLNIMVEKLLETATLDSDKLELNKEATDVAFLVQDIVGKFQEQTKEKVFRLNLKVDALLAQVDVFHFENAINNILDNAIKYGGSKIFVDLIPKDSHFEIHISDNGSSLSEANKRHIFEKFYRVPKGNTHDVKGFGIGLFYTKTIVEKHGGTIDVELNNALTTFKITIPNA